MVLLIVTPSSTSLEEKLDTFIVALAVSELDKGVLKFQNKGIVLGPVTAKLSAFASVGINAAAKQKKAAMRSCTRKDAPSDLR
ncbi:hypothetical protein YTPLAS18_18620 [Nitrospira sp.]|nr:hypothetical protein YTPLAS18_18620 [Nitrospira sp.]